jgi:hypothetical protein
MSKHFVVGLSHTSQTLIYILLQIIYKHIGAGFNKIPSTNYNRKVKRAITQQYKEFTNKGNYDVSCKFPPFLVSNKNSTGNKFNMCKTLISTTPFHYAFQTLLYS